MEVRPGSPSSLSHISDMLTLRNFITDRHVIATVVPVDGEEILSLNHNDATILTVGATFENNHTVVSGIDRGSLGSTEISSLMKPRPSPTELRGIERPMNRESKGAHIPTDMRDTYLSSSGVPQSGSHQGLLIEWTNRGYLHDLADPERPWIDNLIVFRELLRRESGSRSDTLQGIPLCDGVNSLLLRCGNASLGETPRHHEEQHYEEGPRNHLTS
jgi:hypothetical protein